MSAVADAVLRVVNPATLEEVARVPSTPPEAVQDAVDEAAAAQRLWGAAPHRERRELLVTVAELVLDRADEIVETAISETAKPRTEALASEVYPAADTLVWLASNAARVLAPERVRAARPVVPQKRAWVLYEPLGVVAVISPWNLPFAIAFTQVAHAVAAGNAAVVKPSELAPLSGALVERLFADAGAPAGLVRVVQGDAAVGDALVRADGVAKIVFTGSVGGGRLVAAAAAERLVPLTLELSGKDPMLVLDDAELDRAAAGAAWGAFLNAGQVCSGIERVYVEGGLYEPFVEELARRASALRLGEDVGPLVTRERREAVEELVDDASARGAEVRAGGRVPARRGWFYEPTVLTRVPADARIRREEIFGPVVTVERVAGEEEAVAAANDSTYGLSASVWTRDPERAARVARRLDVGSVWHNDHSYSYGLGAAPWGGRKDSGFGRTHSRHGLYDLSNVKYVDRDGGAVRPPWWYPYDARGADALAGALGVLYRRGVRGRAEAAWRHRRGLLHLARRYAR